MFKILSIHGIETDGYNMWYRHEKKLHQKVFIVSNTVVAPTNKIIYVCDCCGCIHETILRTFNDRLCSKYNNYKYLCRACVSKKVYLTTFEKNERSIRFKELQEKTKSKNGTTPRQLISKNKTYGFIGLDQSTGSEIRNKMHETKDKNNSNTTYGTDAYFKRLATYKLFDNNKKESITLKQNTTKINNNTHPKQKYSRGEVFGFCNISELDRKKLAIKIDKILKQKDDKGLTKYHYANRSRIEKMKACGKLIKDSELSDFKLYKKRVWQATNLQNLKSLNNYHLRGRSDLNNSAYHLDHKYSIKFGFQNNIPIHIMGNILNLEMLPYKENTKKQDKCSIDILSLFELINNGYKSL